MRFPPRIVLLLVTWIPFAAPIVFAQNSYQTATVISVRQIRRSPGLNPSRFVGPVYYTMDFAIRISDNNYCVDYETPVLDEVRDLRAASGKEVQVETHGKKFFVVLPTGRKIKGELAKPVQC